MAEKMFIKKIEILEKRVAELQNKNEYYKSECNSIWADFRKRKSFNLEIAQRIVTMNSKAVANIILNMYYGKIPSDSVDFCEIFGLRDKGYCKEGLRCTDCIDGFLIAYYKERLEGL